MTAMAYDLDLKYSRAQYQIFFPTKDAGFPKFSHIRKGRRVGLTRGAAQAYIEYALTPEDDPEIWFLPKGPLLFLWGDTINGNIRRYYERYFLPILKKIPRRHWKWNSTDKVLKIGRVTIDFRSSDNPENWEGQGYHLIFLNEAGIILEDEYLYQNAVLPMLMDYEESRLIAAGVPKGKRTAKTHGTQSKGNIHTFYQMYLDGQKDPKNYRMMCFSSYHGWAKKEQIDLIASVMDEMTRKQEIDGEFVDMNDKPFIYVFSEERHVIPSYTPHRGLPLLISFDFNVEPCTATVSQKPDYKSLVIFDEIEVSPGSTPEVIAKIKAKYPEFALNWDVTGDATGKNRTSMIQGNLNHYEIIVEEMKLNDHQLLVPTVNPGHLNSRLLVNSTMDRLYVRITANCEKIINDCILCMVDSRGQLVKTQMEGRHFLDNVRYTIHAAFPDYFEQPGLYF